MEYHEAANIYPLMKGKAFDELVEDIKANGLLEPIIAFKGKILDGRNRFRACGVAGVEPRFKEWDGEGGSPTSFVISHNGRRRHLTVGQLTVAAMKAEKLFAREAKEKEAQRKAAQGKATFQKIEKSAPVHASKRAVQEVGGSNPQYIADGKKIERDAPELLDEVAEGNLTIPDAKQVAELPPEERSKAVEEIKAAPTAESKREVVRRSKPKREKPLYELVYEGANKAAKMVADMNQLGGVCVIAEMEDWEPEQRQVVLDAVKRAAKALYDFHNELAEINERMYFDGEEEATDFQYPN